MGKFWELLASKVGSVKAELIGAKMVMLTFAAARELVYPVFCMKGAPFMQKYSQTAFDMQCH